MLLLNGRGETNPAVGGIEDGVVILEELLTDDEVDIGLGDTSIADVGVVLAGGEAVVGVLMFSKTKFRMPGI